MILISGWSESNAANEVFINPGATTAWKRDKGHTRQRWENSHYK